MRYLGWKKLVKKEKTLEEQELIDIYVFDNPELRNYGTDFIGVSPSNGYSRWKKIKTPASDELIEINERTLYSIGIHKDNLQLLNGEKVYHELSKKIGIDIADLEKILGSLVSV